MNLGILHYHLERGGVTRVIENHLRSLDASASTSSGSPLRALVLHGGRRDAWRDDLAATFSNVELDVQAVPGLDYDQGTSFDPRPLTAALRRTLHAAGFDPAETVLHVHNHSLGKNLALPPALRDLSADGFALLLQLHDFPEDFRPENDRRNASAYGADRFDMQYPRGSRIRYAVLNGRDLAVLAAAGVPPGQLHLLPNPVPTADPLPDRRAAREHLHDRFDVPTDVPYLLYPVRGIRRKNIGEAVLWSAAFGDRAAVGVTLAPLNPVERAAYDEWVEFTRTLGLGTRWGTGEAHGLSFAENLAAADAVLTTSIAEGFGMAFLEPWTYDLPLVGRNLPEITTDFTAAGLCLDTLYDRLPIPLDWIGRETFAAAFRTAAEHLTTAYGRTLSSEAVEAAIDGRTTGDVVDFGDLDAPMQRTVVGRIAADEGSRKRILALLPPIPGSKRPVGSLVAHNRDVVAERFSLAACGESLRDLYAEVLVEPCADALGTLPHADGILGRFLDLDRLRLLRGA